MKNLILIIILSLSFRLAIARKPAVDPVRGLSTDHYKKVPLQEVKGFDWSKEKSTKNNAPTKSADFFDNEVKEKIADAQPIALIIFFALLPIGIFIAVTKTKRQSLDKDAQKFNLPINVHPLRTKTDKKDNDDHEDFNFPKVS